MGIFFSKLGFASLPEFKAWNTQAITGSLGRGERPSACTIGVSTLQYVLGCHFASVPLNNGVYHQ